MRKLYFLLLSTVICLQAVAQSHTVIIWGTGASGSNTTGTSSAATTTEGSMSVFAGPSPDRAWVVFDLSSLPSDATIISASVGINIESITGFMSPVATTYGIPGNISALTPPATLFAAMVNPPAVAINNFSYGTAYGHRRIAVNAAGITSLQSSIGGDYSVAFTTTSNWIYGLTGETGLADSSAAHAPFIAIKYRCSSLTSISAVASPSTACDGSSITLTGTASGASSYQWSFPGGGSSLSNIATHTIAGSGNYTFTPTSPTGCSVDSVIHVTAIPAPAPAITASGSTVLCVGNTVTLDGTTAGAVSYQWYNGGVPISGETNATYEASNSGNFTIEVTNSSGCSGTSASTGVALLNALALTPAGTANLCVSGSTNSLLLTVSTGGVGSGIDYQWQNAGVVIPGATNSSYSATASGAYYAIVSASSGGCTTTSDTTHVNIAGTPNPSVIFTGGALLTTSAYVAYQWFLSSTAIPGATSAAYVPTVNGSYRVRVTNVAGCTNFSSALTIGNVGVGQLSRESVKVYPNPAVGVIKVDAPVKCAVVITSIAGKTMISGTTNDNINIDQLAPGIYFVAVYNEQGERIVTEKLIKE